MLSHQRWTALRVRVDALPADRQAAFALACATGVVGSGAVLLAALETGWSALLDGSDAAQVAMAQVVMELARSPELDDDDVAATCYALRAVRGDEGAAWWAASRAVDHAFAGVPYAAEKVFRALEVDAREPVVQAELARQVSLLQIVESDTDLAEVVVRLRSS